MKVSKRGRAFISAHEGNPLTAYLDPVGIPTIGHGFTMRSAVAKQELKKLGITKLVPGKTKLSAEQSDAIFDAVLNSNEFAGAVRKGIPAGRTVKQHMFDAMLSASFNLGPGFMGWRWKEPWAKSNDVKGAAAIWRNNYNTAAGKKLPGLVRRRREEADMFEHGTYAGTPAMKEAAEVAPATPDDDVKEAQDALSKLGIDPGASDGWYGPKTSAAIRKYQSMHPHLTVDGKLGPATLSQLRRDVVAVREAVTETGGLVTGTGLLSFFTGLPVGWIVGGALVLTVAYFAWRYRDVWQRRLNKLLGRRHV
jgi:lysozyme